jgi:MFS family permease
VRPAVLRDVVPAWARGAWTEAARDLARILRTPGPTRLALLAGVPATMASALLLPAMPPYLMQRGVSFAQLGAAYSVLALALLLANWAATRPGSPLGRPGFVLAALWVPVATYPMYLWARTPVAFMGLMAVSGLCAAAAGPGMQALLAQAAGDRAMAASFAHWGLLTSLAHAAGLVLGGVLLAHSFRAVFLGATALSVAAAVTALAVGLRAAGAPSEAADAARRLQRHRQALEARLPLGKGAARDVALVAAYMFLFTASLAVYPVYLPSHFLASGVPPAWLGVAVASSWLVFGAVQVVGARWSDRTGRHRLLIAASLAVSAALNLALAAPTLPLMLAAWVLLGASDGLGRPVTGALVARSLPAAHLTRAYGWVGVAAALAGVLAPYGLAMLAGSGGFPTVLAATSALLLAATVPVLLLGRTRAPATVPVEAAHAA